MAFVALCAREVPIMLRMGILFVRFSRFFHDFIVKSMTSNASFVLSIIDHLQSRLPSRGVARITLYIFADMSVC